MIDTWIYKRTSTGAVQKWKQEANPENTAFRSVSGQVDGKIVESAWKFVKQKNIGKKNETSLFEQVLSEVESNYKDKLSKGYVKSIDNIDSEKLLPFKPMLALAYDKMPEIADWSNVYSQPKLDGIRGVVSKNSIKSRSDKPLPSSVHIPEALDSLFNAFNVRLDGELYTHKFHDDFNTILSLARKTKPTAEDLEAARADVQYWVYDIAEGVDDVFSKRFEYLQNLSTNFPDNVILVPTTKVNSQEELDELYAQYIEDGYEGQMVRTDTKDFYNGNSTQRSKSLLKRKHFFTEEYEVVDIVVGKGNRGDKAGRITYKMPDGREFGSGIKGSFEYAMKILNEKEKYIGGQGTVRFPNFTPSGLPRFGVTVALYPEGRDI